MVRKQWSKSDIKEFIKNNQIAVSLMDKKSNVFEDNNILFIDQKPFFFRVENGGWIPTIRLLLEHQDLLPKVFVDKGAIRFVVKGADIMRPGVTACEDFQKDDFVVVVDEAYSKPLAIAKAIYDSKITKEMEEGKVFFNVHHIGDNIWNSV